MSDSYLYHEYKDCYNDSKEQTKDKKNKILKILVILLTVVLVIEAILYTIVMPSLNPAKISFSGANYVNTAKLISEAGINQSQNWMSFDTAAFASAISSNALIESVSVEKRFPDQILVQVKERVPVASTLVNINGKTASISFCHSASFSFKILCFSASIALSASSSIAVV